MPETCHCLDDGDAAGSAHVHRSVEAVPGVRIHTVLAGAGEPVVVLLHGFPQTWREWRHTIPALVEAGYRVVAPDYRGAGGSTRTPSGYDKETMAGDIAGLLDALDITRPVRIASHDIGLMVAFAFTRLHPERVARLVVTDAPLPGTAVFDEVRSDHRLWHFAFHNARDIAEALVAGRERMYLRAFIDSRGLNPAAVSGADFDAFVDAYSSAGGIRAGFELYRAFDGDRAANRAALERDGKIRTPVLAIGAGISVTGRRLGEMMEEFAEDVTYRLFEDSGHWIPEEHPREYAAALVEFFDRAVA